MKKTEAVAVLRKQMEAFRLEFEFDPDWMAYEAEHTSLKEIIKENEAMGLDMDGFFERLDVFMHGFLQKLKEKEERNGNDKIIILPNKEEMFERLLKVNDTDYNQRKFYPSLLENAGKEKSVQDIVTMFMSIIYKRIPYMKITLTLVYRQADDFVDALVDDAEMAQQTKDLLQETLLALIN